MIRLFLLLIFVMTARTGSALVYERFEEAGKVGIRDEQGKVVVPASFDALGWSDGSFSLLGEITGYRQAGRWGLLNLRKEYITKAEFTSLTSAGGNYVRASRAISPIATKTGCINLKGDVVIPFAYDDLTLHDLRAIVMIKDLTRYQYGLLDLSNKTILPVIYQNITPLGSLRYAVRDFHGKTALCTEEGKWITGFDIDSLSVFHGGAAILYKGPYRGVIDRMGQIQADALYRDVVLDPSGSVKVRKPDAWKILDVQQRELHRTEADAITPLAANRYRRTLNGKSGLVDSLFRELIPTAYDYVGPVAQDKFIAGIGRKYGLMRTSGSLILPIVFDTLIRDGHLLRAKIREKGITAWHLYDTVGVRKTSRSYDRIEPQIQGLYPVFHQGYAGAVDRVGRETVACVYDSLVSFSGDRIVVKFKGLYGIISREDVWQLPPQPKPLMLVGETRYLIKTESLSLVKDYSGNIIYFTDNPVAIKSDYFLEQLPDGSAKEVSFNGQLVRYRLLEPGAMGSALAEEHEGLTVVRRDGKFGFVDERGRLRIANRYEEAGNFQEGLAPVRILGKWGFIDKADQIVIHPAYDRRSEFHHGLAIVARAGRSGLIDREGNTRLELRYDSIRQVDSRTFLCYLGGRCGLADNNGRVLLEPRFDSIEPVEEDKVIASQAGRYGLLSRDGLSLFPMKYQALRYNSATRTFFVREPAEWELLPAPK